jgi:uncharacterized protein with PQ loop repeat
VIATLGLTSPITQAAGILAAGLTICRTVPQTYRVVRISTEGVSSATWLITFFGNLTWFCYGVFNNVPAEWYANLPCFILAGSTFVLIHARRNTLKRGILLALGVIGVTAITVIIGEASGHLVILSFVCVSAAFVMFLPQAYDATTATDLTGISITAWSLGMATATMWGVFGIMAHKPPVYAPVFVQLPACTTVVIRTVMNRRRRRTHLDASRR